MSLLDDENILTTDLKKKVSNPFFLLKQIFILAYKDNNRVLFKYKDDILNILKRVEIPKYAKWHINYNIVELVDKSYCGEPGDYYKVFARFSFFRRTEHLMLVFNARQRSTHGNVYGEFINEFTKPKYDLIQANSHVFIYKT